MRTVRPSLNVILDKSKMRKDGKSPLFIQVVWKGKRAKESCGVFLDEVEYQNEKKRVFLGCKLVKKRLGEVEDRIAEIMSETGDFNPKTAFEKGSIKINKNKVLNDMISDKKLKEGTVKTYRTTMRAFEEYFGEFSLDELTRPKIEGFARSVTVQPQTVGNYLKCMKSLLEYAKNRGIIKENVMDGWSFKKDGYKCIDKPESLNNDEILNLTRIFNTTTDKKLKEAVGIWLSGYWFCGLAFVDLMKINWNKVEPRKFGGEYYYNFNVRRTKTNEVANVWTPVTPLTQELLKLLKTEPWKKLKNYDIMLNRELKKISPNLHYYQCRHSFATKMVNKGVSINTIASLLGRNVGGISVYIQKVTEGDTLAKAVGIGGVGLEEGEALF